MFSKTTSVLTAKGAILFAAPGALLAPGSQPAAGAAGAPGAAPTGQVAARLEPADEE
jgi:hypothetical protein